MASISTMVSPATGARLASAVTRSGRDGSVQFPLAFVRRASRKTALAQMIGGKAGRGGEVRLKVYLMMCLLATSSPYDIREEVSASSWARSIGLEDPRGAGARRVADAITWLDANELIKVTGKKKGKPGTIKLLSVRQDREDWSRGGNRWVRLPLSFWNQQWIVALSGPAIALLLILTELQGGVGPTDPRPYARSPRKAEYWLSTDTWTRAAAELVEMKLLTVRPEVRSEDFGVDRLVNTYWLDHERLESPPPGRGA